MLSKEAHDAKRINTFELCCTQFCLKAVLPKNAVQFEMRNRSYKLDMKLGLYQIPCLEIQLVEG